MIEEMLDILRRLDVQTVKAQFPGLSDYGILAGMHKARYHSLQIEPALRHESAEWLRTHDFDDYGGGPLLPPGELPC